jgi:hypothetical protein
VHRLEALEAFRIVRAPFDGIVTARNTDIGAYIPLGSGIQALLFTSGKPAVGVVHQNGTVEIRKIAINRDLGSKLVISHGLSESDQIITSPPPGLVDGGAVNVVSSNEPVSLTNP